MNILLEYLLFSFTVALAASALSNLATYYPFKRAHASSWIEKARRAYPIKITGQINPFILAFIFGTFGWLIDPYFSLGGLGAFTAGMLTYIGFEYLIKEGKYSILTLIKSHISIWLIFYYPFFILPLLLFMPDSNSPYFWPIYLLIFCFYCLLANCGTIFLARIIGLAKPPTERLEALIKETSQETGIHIRKAYIIQWSMANALAYPLAKILVVSDAAMQQLNDQEIKALLKHEYGHFSEPLLLKLIRQSGLLFLFLLFSMGNIYNLYDFIGVIIVVAIALSGLSGLNRLARKMEIRADKVASKEDDGTYAKMLEKLYRVNLIPVVTGNKKATHPDLYDRMVQAGEQPSYPRPKPPSKVIQYVSYMITLVISILSIIYY